MLFAFYNRYVDLNRTLFREPNAPIGDDLLLPFVRLREEATRRGIEVCTPAECKRRPAGVVFLDYPGDEVIRRFDTLSVPLYLIHFENETIVPENFDRTRLARFSRVFTWHSGLLRDDLSDPAFFVRLNYAQDLPPISVPGGKREFCCMIASRKANDDPRSLYGEREKTMRHFADHYCGFHVYGPGWQGQDLGAAWRYTIPPGQKRLTLQQYDFAICYENAQGIPGYITEKVFDCFLAGTIPIYWGAPDVADLLWPETFIDRRKFRTNEELYHHLRGMTEEEKRSYHHMIDAWLGSADALPYTIEHWTKTLLDTLVEDVKR